MTVRRHQADNHLTRQEWEMVRFLLKVRCGGLCEANGPTCLYPDRQVPDRDVEVQHRRAQAMGGTDLEDANTLPNLLWLCRACHRWVESRPDGALDRGLWLCHDYDDQGQPIPVSKYPLVLSSGRRVYLNPTVGIYDPHPDPYGALR